MTLNLNVFSPRLIKLLILLVEHSDYVPVAALAEKLGTSKRTLFREIQGCNRMLQPFGMQLETKSGVGIRLLGEPADKSRLLKTLMDHQSTLGFYDKEQRRMMLTAELLKNKSIVKLLNFAQLFDVSEATISNDMDLLDEWFNRYRLKLTRRPGLGVYLEGNEDDVRKAMTDFVHLQLEENKLMDLIYMHRDKFDFEDYFSSSEPNGIMSLLNRKILIRVIEVLKENKEGYLQRMAESSFIGLVIHLTIAIERMINHEIIDIDSHLFEELKDDEDYDKAKVLAEYMEDEFEIEFPDAEIAYILMHLKGAKLRYLDSSLDDDLQVLVKDYDIKRMVEMIIRRYEQITGISLIDDEVLETGMITHLRPALTRMYYQLEIRNPLLEQIKDQYAEVYKNSKKACDVIEVELKQKVPDDEIGYLAMHFGAAIERLNQRMQVNRTIRIGVVCASGIGISSLLSSRIRSLFPEIHEVKPLAMEDVKAGIEREVDLLVTTLVLKQQLLPSVYVHPLLANDDIEKIRSAIAQSKLVKNELFKKDESLSDKIDEIGQINNMIKQLIGQIEVIEISSDYTFDRLIDSCAHLTSSDEAQYVQIHADLVRRESMGSVILENERIILFHAKTSAIREPIVKILLSDKDGFNDVQAKKAAGILLMLIGSPALKIHGEILSQISQSCIEDNRLSLAIINKNHDRIVQEIENVCTRWYRNEMLRRMP
ncbi:MAG: PRD domain-containing protein [Erysipelotrichaceae bacterium]|nr:PRD domain-containing protein [Erysipelotrichaceae bacterium]